jgi:hypothetical protein
MAKIWDSIMNSVEGPTPASNTRDLLRLWRPSVEEMEHALPSARV